MLLVRVARTLRRFGASNDGAITVEWVAIAAAVCVGAVAVAYIVLNGLGAPAQKIGSTLLGVGGT